MRTSKLVTTVAVALALLYSAGCDSCQYYEVVPVSGCAPAVAPGQQVIVYRNAPPPRAVRRRNQRFARTRPVHFVATPEGVQAYQDLGTATLVTDPGYVPTVVEGETAGVIAAAPVQVVAAEPVVVAAPERPTKVVYKRGRIRKQRRRAKTAATVPAPIYAGPVYSAPDVVATETVVPEPVITDGMFISTPLEGVTATEVVVETAEPKPEEPSYAKYLIDVDDTPAGAVPADAEPVVEAAVPAVNVPGGEPLPTEVQSSVVTAPVVDPEAPLMAVTVPAEQIAQVSPYQVGQQVTQEQLYHQIVALQQLYQQMAQQSAMNPVVSEPMYAMAGPVDAGFEPGVMNSGYCPPSVCPAPAPIVCAPGQNLSECFTLNEYQLLNSPQIFVPVASNPLTIAVVPAPIPAAPQMSAPAAPVPAAPPALPPAEVGGSSKYEALVPPEPVARPSRPEVTMPAPLGTGDTMPPIAGTQEIENALDAMLSRDPANPGMLK